MTFKENVRWGVSKGLKFAVFCVLFLIVPLIARAIEPEGQRPVSFPLVVVGYFAGAVLGGAVIGALRPLARWPGGSILIGIVAGPLIMAALGPAMFGSPDTWGVDEVLSIVVPGMMLGAILGAVLPRTMGRGPSSGDE